MVPLLTVVVPMYNEEAVLPLLVERLRPVLNGLDSPYEVVAVDDGSVDLTAAILERFRREWPELRVLRLRMNSGHQHALGAGLEAARGDYVVSIDCDLQDPPELIPEMLRVARTDDVDVVYGVRTDRSSDTRFKRWTAGWFYALINMLTRGGSQDQSGDFRLMSRQLVDAVNALPVTGRVIRFVVPALGFPFATVEYRRDPRPAGRTKYGLWSMVQLSLDSITSVSIAPLRIATIVGLLGGVLAVAVGFVSVIAHFVGGTLPGWTSTVTIVSGFSALQLLCLGIFGEYLGRAYSVLLARPAYVVAYDSGVRSEAPSSALKAAASTDDPNQRS